MARLVRTVALLPNDEKMKAFVLVGAPGAGKSTLAFKLALQEDAAIISGDDIRKELYGSWEIQGNWVEVNDRIEQYVESCAERGVSVILDGTHYRTDYRNQVATLLRSYGYEDIEAIVVNPSLATCLARNFRRSRNVPDYTVREIYDKLQASLPHIEEELFTKVTFWEKENVRV